MKDLNYNFSKESRLLNSKQFNFVFQKATRVSTSEIVVFSRKNNLSYPRLGLAIAKKNVKKAHDRNLIKRLCRERFRLMRHELPNFDYIVIVRSKILELNKHEINLQLMNIWSKHIRLALVRES